jgi:phage terminase large subunit-like protein
MARLARGISGVAWRRKSAARNQWARWLAKHVNIEISKAKEKEMKINRRRHENSEEKLK